MAKKSGDADIEANRVSKAEAQEKPKPKRKVTLRFRGNRSFTVMMGSEWYKFGPFEEKRLDRSVLQTEGFKNAREYFVVKE